MKQPNSRNTTKIAKRSNASMPMTTKRSILMAALTALMLVAGSTSGFSADARRGERFARQVCATCHVVGREATSDLNAPSFRSIAVSEQFRKKGMAWLWERHPKMPNLATSREELGDVEAYIKSLAE
jgi:mono/diheme cytochrome c family protein